MEHHSNDPNPDSKTDDKSFFGIIIHSFFVIPFIIAVASVALFASMQWLTREHLTAYDYLEQIREGGLTKRWQAAFELSKILANPKLIPRENRFRENLISVFQNSERDDPRVRQYLAMAMAKTQDPEFLKVLLEGLKVAKDDETKLSFIYSLGMLNNKNAVPALIPLLNDPNSRIRSVTVGALGTIGDKSCIPMLKKMLNDDEPNVRWVSAISLATLMDSSGKEILINLLDRAYLSRFPQVDQLEQNQILLESIRASANLNDEQLNKILNDLAKTDINMAVRQTAQQSLARIK